MAAQRTEAFRSPGIGASLLIDRGINAGLKLINGAFAWTGESRGCGNQQNGGGKAERSGLMHGVVSISSANVRTSMSKNA